MGKIKYNAQMALDKSLTVQSQVVGLAGKNKEVLEVGCNIGETSLVLKNNQCKITGVEINSKAAKIAKNICDNLIIGDIERDKVWDKITNIFDIIIFADILEHLRNPANVLKKSRNFLKNDGFLIISVPNVANWRVRLSLLFGKFEYKSTGILDESHLRFYTLESAKKLIQKNYKIVNFFPAATNVPKILLLMFPTIFATQWIFKCK